MTTSSFNIIISVYLSFTFHSGNGFVVIQPQNRTVNPDGMASISCEHNASGSSVIDVRLKRILPTSNEEILCKKGQKDCRNVLLHSEKSTKWIFILFNIKPEDMNRMYQCEFTVFENDLHITRSGEPTRLLQGQKKTEKDCPSAPPCPPGTDKLWWLLIGLLALMFLCTCVIICLYIRLRKSKEEHENCTYVEMRKAPSPFDIYSAAV